MPAKTQPPTFGARVREKRLAAGLSQVELAERMGIPQNRMSVIEREGVDPRLTTVVAVAKALGCTLEELA